MWGGGVSKYVTVEVPFLLRGNRQILTDLQIAEQPWIWEFIERFRNCFERDDYQRVWVYCPEGL